MYFCRMKKKLTFILIICAITCISTSCARKINGATPHRRDRNCGCENISAPGNPAELTLPLPEQTDECYL